MSTYSEAHGSVNFQVSDGGARIIYLFYGVCFLFAVIIGAQGGCGSFIGALVLTAPVPGLVGGLSGFIHYMAFGWWNARVAGNFYVYTMILLQCLLLIGFLVYLLQTVRAFKNSHIAALEGGTKRKRVFFWLLIFTDVGSLIANIHLVIQIIFG